MQNECLPSLWMNPQTTQCFHAFYHICKHFKPVCEWFVCARACINWWWSGLMLLRVKQWRFFSLFEPDVLWMSPTLCLARPVPGSLSSLLHLRNRQRQPLPASMPGTLPDPTMPGSSAVLMPVSVQQQRAHSTFTHGHYHACTEEVTHPYAETAQIHTNYAGLQFLDGTRVQLKQLVTVYEEGIWCRNGWMEECPERLSGVGPPFRGPMLLRREW